MASTLYVCVKCLRNLRVVGYCPPDFDNICDDCRITEMLHAGDVEGTQSPRAKKARVKSAADKAPRRGDAARPRTARGKAR